MNGSQDLQRLFGICDGCPDEGFFYRAKLAFFIPGTEIPSGRYNILVILYLFIFNLDPMSQRTPGYVIQTIAHSAAGHIPGLIGFGVTGFEVFNQFHNPALYGLADSNGFKAPGGRPAKG